MHAGATTEHLTEISIQISWLLRSLVSEPSAQISMSWSTFGRGSVPSNLSSPRITFLVFGIVLPGKVASVKTPGP